ncbi:mycofactocin precursor MftA [Nocardioides sp. LS1]|nr:mycofactocin precursor MftA [Nocardioides sp. LS1]
MNPAQNTAADADQSSELLAEDLIEEVSIDGMCGVY